MSDLQSTDFVDSLTAAACALWAKSPDRAGLTLDENAWLPLYQHMLDSGGTADALWDLWVSMQVKQSICTGTGLSDEEARILVAWLACVHDIGKAQLSFQLQLDEAPGREQFSQRLRDAGLPTQMSSLERNLPKLPHGLASGILVTQWLDDAGVAPKIAGSLAAVVDAHHGIPSTVSLREGAEIALEAYGPEWKAVWQELLTLAAETSGIDDVLPQVRKIHGPTQNLLTGIVIMADWMASHAGAFPLAETSDQEARLVSGLEAFDLTVPWEPDPAPLEGLTSFVQRRFRWPTSWAPRPVQSAIAEICAAITGPALLIVEAPTGEGKTEAALLAAEYLAAETGAGGIIVAAPTMATANGLFGRVRDWASQANTSDSPISMFLGHSKSMLNESYRTMRRRGASFQSIDKDSSDSGALVASEWMSGRKKGILSNIVVATVDQVLFMALQSKHSMLRHLGLASKVVVIDEVHAYDTYMSQYLHQALRWLARYGVPVILLSATLPVEQKRELLAAYAGQLDAEVPDTLSTAYPLVTSASADGVQEHPVAARPPDITASLELVSDDLEELATRISGETADGGCVLVICNTIRRAQEAFERLSADHPNAVVLHHAAFAASDRATKEDELRAELGPAAHRGDGRPDLRIVVATQVAEQSLDIDVDLLITDIAPIDLIIQRIGRLHRHRRPVDDRPERLRSARVLVRAVLATEPVPEFDTGTAFVYDPRLLLSTLAVLRDGPFEHGFTRPDDVAQLVQQAYGTEPPIPAAWTDAWAQAVAKSEKERQRSQKRAQTFLFPDPNRADSLDKQFSAQNREVGTTVGEAAGLAQVRDSDPTLEVIPIVFSATGYSPLPWLLDHDIELMADRELDRDLAFLLAGSTVRLPSRFGRDHEAFDALVTHLENVTPRGWRASDFVSGALALPLDEQFTVELAGRTLVYDRMLGLQDLTSSVGPRP